MRCVFRLSLIVVFLAVFFQPVVPVSAGEDKYEYSFFDEYTDENMWNEATDYYMVEDNCVISVYSEDEAILRKIRKVEGDVIFPETVAGYKIIGIGEKATGDDAHFLEQWEVFLPSEREGITSITVPESYEWLGLYSLSHIFDTGFTNLKKLTFLGNCSVLSLPKTDKESTNPPIQVIAPEGSNLLTWLQKLDGYDVVAGPAVERYGDEDCWNSVIGDNVIIEGDYMIIPIDEKTKTARLIKVRNVGEEVFFPDRVAGYTITGIGWEDVDEENLLRNEVFLPSERWGITNIQVPAYVEWLGKNAFNGLLGTGMRDVRWVTFYNDCKIYDDLTKLLGKSGMPFFCFMAPAGSKLYEEVSTRTHHVAYTCYECLYYTIRKGDTLCKLSRMFGVTVDQLVKKNPRIFDPDRIYAGNEIMIDRR